MPRGNMTVTHPDRTEVSFILPAGARARAPERLVDVSVSIREGRLRINADGRLIVRPGAPNQVLIEVE